MPPPSLFAGFPSHLREPLYVERLPAPPPAHPSPSRLRILGSLKRAKARETVAPLFRFGLVADVQYAQKDTQIRSTRRFAWSESLVKLAQAVREWNSQRDLAFVLSLGDIIEGNESYMERLSERELRAVLNVFSNARAPVRHILGNHCRRLSKGKLLPLLGLSAAAYYDFSPAPGWRIVCLDTTELCGAAIDACPDERRTVQRMAAGLGRPVHHFHGAVSEAQLMWLGEVLRDTRARGERVIIMTHYPLKGARASHLALNSDDILAVIDRSQANVVAVFAGHDHKGATVLPDARSDVAFLTLPAMVESPQDGNAFATVAVYPNGTLQVTGHGSVPSYKLRAPGCY